MKKILCVYFVTLISATSIAQDLEMSPLFQTPGMVYSIAKKDNYLYVVRSEGAYNHGSFLTINVNHLFKYDLTDFSLVEHNKHDKKTYAAHKELSRYFKDFSDDNNNGSLNYSSSYSAKDKKLKISTYVLDYNKMDIENKKGEVFNFPTSVNLNTIKYSYSIKNVPNYYNDDFVLMLSFSNTWMRMALSNIEEPENSYLFFFDQDGVFKKQIEIEKTPKELLAPLFISQEGDLFVKGKEVHAEGIFGRIFSDRIFLGKISVTKEDDKLEQIELSKGYDVFDLDFAYKNKKLFVFYYESNKDKVPTKLEFKIFDPVSFKETEATSMKVDSKFWQKYLTSKDASKKEEKRVFLQNVKIDKNGDAILFLYLQRDVVISGPKTTYYYDDIFGQMVVKMDKYGKVLWNVAIPRSTLQGNSIFLANVRYFISSKSNDIYLFFNDKKENVGVYDPNNIKKANNVKFDLLRMIIIDGGTGKIKEDEALLDYKENKTKLNTYKMDDEDVSSKAYLYFNEAHLSQIGVYELK